MSTQAQSSVTGGKIDVRWGPRRAGGRGRVETPNDDPRFPRGRALSYLRTPPLKGQVFLPPPTHVSGCWYSQKRKGHSLPPMLSYLPSSCPGQLLSSPWKQLWSLASGENSRTLFLASGGACLYPLCLGVVAFPYLGWWVLWG